MAIEHLAIELRPRGCWEAIDVGFRMARRHYVRMLKTSLILTLPIFALAQTLFHAHPVVAILIPWWLKPIWERAHLHLLGRALFGAAPSTGETLRALASEARIDWLPWLTLRRFSLTRSFDLPVTQLEGLRGRERARRIGVLRKGEAATGAFWLTMVGVHVESFLVLALAALVFVILPESAQQGFGARLAEWATGADPAASGVADFLYATAIHGVALMVAPFYVAAGFSLYVHRRAVLEGWDLEIAFRRLARRLVQADRPPTVSRGAQPGRASAGGLVLGCAVLAAGSVLLGAADARAEGDANGGPAAAREEIEAVLAGEAFHTPETLRLPRFLYEWRAESRRRERTPQWLTDLLGAMAGVAEVLLVAGLLAAVGYLVLRAARFDAGPARGSPVRARAAPAEVLGLDITRDSLPSDVTAEVLARWRRGERRAAVALLYRATLSRLVLAYAVELAPGSTEAECERAAAARLEGEPMALVARLTAAWTQLAYGHRAPSDAQLEALCVQWRRCFDAPQGTSHAERDALGEERGR